jgi:toxin HigB-1
MAIQSYADRETEDFHCSNICPAQWQKFAKVARRKLDMVDYATVLDDLRVPPGNRLEALKGDRKGQHSIRINDQWRVCFRWTDAGPAAVEIVDYH